MATSLPTYTGDTTALVQPTGNAVTDALIVGSKWGVGGAGTGAAVTFSFPAALDKFDTRAGVAGNYNPTESTQGGYAAYLQGFAAFGAAEQTAAREVLASWAGGGEPAVHRGAWPRPSTPACSASGIRGRRGWAPRPTGCRHSRRTLPAPATPG